MGKRDGSVRVAKRPPAWQAAQPLSDVVQQSRLPLRAKERPQKLATGTRVVLDPGTEAFEPLEVAATGALPGEPLEE